MGDYLDQIVARAASTASSARPARSSASAPWPRPSGGRAPSDAAQPARLGQAAPPPAQGARRRSNLEERLRDARPRSAARRPRRRRRRPARHDPPRGSAPTRSRCAISRCAKGSCSTTSSATAKQIAQAERYPDVRRRSVIELGERCNYWPEHAQQVARLALVDLRSDARASTG